jgi:hypothetical protein
VSAYAIGAGVLRIERSEGQNLKLAWVFLPHDPLDPPGARARISRVLSLLQSVRVV